ncbi:hypothetical protein [Halocatena marina]|uniref:hypothetical protein n=1 Tax=Halocatena marina TaxID=2934937 RepID=UPI00200DB320|nr:hypothetical protein [Halocatena marina]
MSSDRPPRRDFPGTEQTGGSALLTYGVPLLGTILVAIGIAGAVLGGYAVIQQQLDLCGNPTVAVSTAEQTKTMTGPSGPNLPQFQFSELSPAEQTAFTTAVGKPSMEGDVRGAFPHRQAFQQGALVTYQGEQRYATTVWASNCLSVDPLLFPLGIVSILLGIGGILTPPVYRKLLEREASRDRLNRESD